MMGVEPAARPLGGGGCGAVLIWSRCMEDVFPNSSLIFADAKK